MTTLAEFADVIPPETADAWPHVAAVCPPDGVLLGGTGLAIHLRHRVSRDLDVFAITEFDPSEIESALKGRGQLLTEQKDRGTLSCLFNGRTDPVPVGDEPAATRTADGA